MKDISKHCSDLSKLVSGNVHHIEWSSLHDLLHIASGIVKVKFDVIRFDNCFGWCSDADEFNSSREIILEEYISELTRFTYVWSALESLIDEIKPKQSPIKGKINSICFYLKNKLSPSDIIPPYSSLMEKLYTLLGSQDINEPEVFHRFKGNKYLSQQGLGIYVIYKLRNLFLHGALNFPFPDENNKPNSRYPGLISLSTRIILLTIQMILMAYYVNSKIQITCFWDEDNENILFVNEVLRNIHFEISEKKSKQLNLY